MKAVLGLDPGRQGAVALLDATKHELVVHDLPMTRDTRGKQKWHVDVDRLSFLVKGLAPDICYIEEVHASPQMGVTSAFSFGENFGSCMGALAAAGVVIVKTRPEIWKPRLEVPAHKPSAISRASELFPRCTSLWQRTKDGRAEAAMIALYGALSEGIVFTQIIEPVA